jgi:hypothetical protein
MPADRRGKPSVVELNDVLLNHLCADKNGRNIRTFGMVEMESDKCAGVHRARYFPFSFDTFQHSNPQQYVGIGLLKQNALKIDSTQTLEPSSRSVFRETDQQICCRTYFE